MNNLEKIEEIVEDAVWRIFRPEDKFDFDINVEGTDVNINIDIIKYWYPAYERNIVQETRCDITFDIQHVDMDALANALVFTEYQDIIASDAYECIKFVKVTSNNKNVMVKDCNENRRGELIND